MLIKTHSSAAPQPHASEITPRAVFEARRRLIKTIALGSIGGGAMLEMAVRQAFAQSGVQQLGARPNPSFVIMDKRTSYKDATSYNNFYEFGTEKSEPAQYAKTLAPRPWTVAVEGEIKKPFRLDVDALLKLAPLEERIYRLRCVEGWSMVIPWIGYSLSELIRKAEPNGNAKYIEFTSLADKKQMPGLGTPVLEWPYVEGLRLDEAKHPLALLCVGMYGELLPNQNGAPVRIVVPWKYGFKSAKSIMRIRFTRDQPRTAWNIAAPREYGFYSNVNPEVDHPRWSQAGERRIGEDGFFARKRKTLLFNGYSEVASLYAGMDLKRFF